MRSLLTTMIDTLMSAEADAICGAEYGHSSSKQVNQRNGYRHRGFDTRAGTLEVAIPKLRHGTYFPHWLLERRRRAEAALTSVIATCYLLWVSTRRMEKLAESWGITRLSTSQVSTMAADLDTQVAAFRSREGQAQHPGCSGDLLGAAGSPGWRSLTTWPWTRPPARCGHVCRHPWSTNRHPATVSLRGAWWA